MSLNKDKVPYGLIITEDPFCFVFINMINQLILVGGGGHCKSVLEAAESAGYSILGVLDMPEEVGKKILSTKVIGTDDDIPAYVDKAEFVITVGFIKNPAVRFKLYNKISQLM